VTVNNGYDVIVSGIDGPSAFTDYSDHPFAPQFSRAPIVWKLPSCPAHESTASGRYQLMYHWWVPYKKELGLADFGPASQDAVALQQARERGALAMLLGGNPQSAIAACSNIWASFPGNSYGESGGKSMQALLDRYSSFLVTGGPPGA
jgi:muramidase (phage lysozyme)